MQQSVLNFNTNAGSDPLFLGVFSVLFYATSASQRPGQERTDKREIMFEPIPAQTCPDWPPGSAGELCRIPASVRLQPHWQNTKGRSRMLGMPHDTYVETICVNKAPEMQADDLRSPASARRRACWRGKGRPDPAAAASLIFFRGRPACVLKLQLEVK